MILYIIWSLLPILLFGLGIWGFVKKISGAPINAAGREQSLVFIKQSVFCFIVLVATIGLEQSGSLNLLEDATESTAFDLRYARWLLYPAILVLAATIQPLISGKKDSWKKDKVQSNGSFRKK